jgi:hypothetical protein
LFGREGSLESRDDLRNVCAIEFLDSGVELAAFLALHEELRNLLAPLDVLWAHLPDLALLRATTLGVQGAKSVLREFALVLLESGLGLCMPNLSLLVRQVLPGEADDLGERAVVGFDLSRDMLALDERGTEEDERVGRTGDVVLWLLLAVCRATGSGTVVRRREELRLADGVRHWGWVVERDRGDVWSERN